VIGPDEYHEDVDDNAYTNLMAAWNLRRGAETADVLKHRWPERWRELARRLQLTDEELTHWPKLAEVIFIGFDPKTLLFEQFSGYFRKEHVDLKSYERRSAAMDVILGFERIQQTDILKQPDVVLATFLLWDEFPPEVREANFRYYEPRTGHGSSLSPSIHALVAARLGDLPLAHDYLKQSSQIDLGNNMGNAAGGVHMAAQGGLWQSVVFGFAGVNAQPDGFRLAPNLLPQWLRLSFLLQWRKSTARVSIEPAAIRIKVQGEPLTVSVVQGTTILALPENDYIAERSEQRWKPWRIIPAAMTQEVL
jgi:trehalose/maltose hydrolase-like predicted phosphorylase